MRRILLLIAFCTLSLTSANDSTSDNKSHAESTTEILKTRIARQLNIPGQEYIVRGHSPSRQVIKIPGNARVKVVHPNSQQSQQRPTRGNKVPNQNRPSRQQPPLQKNRPKQSYEEDDYYDNNEEFKIPKKPIKKTKKGYSVQDISPEEFYDENSDEYEYFQKKPKHKQNSNQKKRYRKPESNYYDSNSQASMSERRPFYDEETGYDFRRTRHRSPQPTSYFDESYGYDDFASSSSVNMKQVPPPNLALNVVDAPDLRKESHSVKKQMNNNQHERYHNNFDSEATLMKKPPSTRQMQSMFQQHYTTHNPHVTRNLGFDEHENERTSMYNSMDNESHESQRHHEYDDLPHQLPSASEHRPTLVPTGSSGIHIVKPPQFRDNIPVGPPSNQRATIRDILLHDCPEAESIGFCASPPRYPTQQINTIMSKCSDIIDAMYSPAPLDSEDDLSSFSSRSDDQDIQFTDSINEMTNATGLLEEWSKWSRSSNDGSNTVCESVLTQTEPGYAREVSSGRWFVIMQTMNAIVQRVLTDTCDRPGKPCAGLAGLKCSRSSSSSHHGYKATRCVQRYTQQRLISWDPETPNSCPKVRIFKFPTACLCHLSID